MSLWVKVREHLAEPMFRNAYALILNTVLSTGFGLAFWIIAARWFSVEEVGRGQTAINTMLLLSGFGSLRLSGAIIRYLPSAGYLAGNLLRRSASVAAGGSVLAVLIYGVVADEQLASTLWSGRGAVLVLMGATAGWTLFTLQDAILIGLRRATWVPMQNAAFSALKVIALLIVAGLGIEAGIFLAWVVPMILVFVPVQILINRVVRSEHTGSPTERPGWRKVTSFVGVDYVSTLTEILIANGIPVMVAALLGFETAGVFATTWIIGTTLDHVLIHFGSSLTVEGVREPAQLAQHARRLLARSFSLLVPLSLGVALLAPLLLSLFGPEYAEDGSALLQLLAIAMVPRIVQTVVVVIAKVRHKLRLVLLINVTQTAVIVAASVWLVDSMGVVGPGVAYLAASALTAVLLIPLLRTLLSEGPSDEGHPTARSVPHPTDPQGSLSLANGE